MKKRLIALLLAAAILLSTAPRRSRTMAPAAA